MTKTKARLKGESLLVFKTSLNLYFRQKDENGAFKKCTEGKKGDLVNYGIQPT